MSNNLDVEWERYTNREIHKLCRNNIKDEFHCISICPLYKNFRCTIDKTT